MLSPDDAAETRTQACDMGVDDVDVDSRGGRAADTAREGGETLPPETEAVEVMKQISRTVHHKMVVVYSEIDRKRKSHAYPMAPDQPDATTANEEQTQTSGLADDLDVHQLPVAVSVLDDIDLIPAVVPAAASTCQVGRPTEKDHGMDQGTEPLVKGMLTRGIAYHQQKEREREREREREAPRGTHNGTQGGGSLGEYAKQLRVSAASSHGVGQPMTKKPARKAMSAQGYRLSHAEA